MNGHSESFVAQAPSKTRRNAENLLSTRPKPANRVYAHPNGNGDEASGDGWRYRGRGPLQITGKSNYLALTAAEGLTPVDADSPASRPDLLADSKHPLAAFRSAAWFFATHHPTDTLGGRNLRGHSTLTVAHLGRTLAAVADLANLRGPTSLRDVNAAITAGINSARAGEQERLLAYRRALVAFFGPTVARV